VWRSFSYLFHADRLVQTHSPTCIIPAQPNWLHYLLDGLSVPRAFRYRQKQVDAVLSWGHDAAFIPGILESKNVVFGMIAAHPSYSMWMNRQTGLKLLKNLTDEWFRFRPLKRADITLPFQTLREELITLFGLESERVIVTYWVWICLRKFSVHLLGGVSSHLLWSLSP